MIYSIQECFLDDKSFRAVSGVDVTQWYLERCGGWGGEGDNQWSQIWKTCVVPLWTEHISCLRPYTNHN